MCIECFKGYGSPDISNERVDAAIKAIHDVYRYSESGGNLHVMLDDMNLDGDFEWDENWLKTERLKWGDDSSDEKLAAEWKCLEIMKNLTLDERVSAVWKALA